nr:MAG TPA: hypothetical protein [Caudoviricetes sp.]DAS22238.1 MAG TPA: hypothetical protein [Caudoviricetes sp.]
MYKALYKILTLKINFMFNNLKLKNYGSRS